MSFEGLQPAEDSRWKRRRPRMQADFVYDEAMRLKPRAVLRIGRVISALGCWQATPRKDGANSHLNGRDIPVTSELGHEAPLRLERTVHAVQHHVGVSHPMQSCIGKHRVEL